MMSVYQKWLKKVLALMEECSDLDREMQDYCNERTQKWTDSEKGESIELAYGAVGNAWSELADVKYELSR